MILTLRVTSEHQHRMGSDRTRTFNRSGGSIGRKPESTWVLPDPERLVSGQHAVIEYEGGEYYLTDTSSNGVFVNGPDNLLGRGNRTRLRHGDTLYFGDYVIEVSLESTAPAVAYPARGEALEGFEEGLAWEEAQPPSAPVTPAAGAPYLLEPGAGGGVGTQRDAVPAHEEEFTPPEAYARLPEDWDRMPTEGPTPAPAGQPAGEATEAPRPAEPEAPAGGRPAGVTPPPAPAPGAPRAPTGEPASLVAVLLEAAGLDPRELAEEDAAALMHTVGEVMREAVAGLREVLLARSEFKSAFRMQLTTIRPVENNPLKFTVGGPAETLRNLLFQRGGGYLPPVTAVHEGFQDIKDHHLAMVAGMKAALAQLLKRFDPKVLEAELERFGGVSRLLGGSKKARLWDFYGAQYETVRRGLDDAFQEVFGNEFVLAYERALLELARDRTASRS